MKTPSFLFCLLFFWQAAIVNAQDEPAFHAREKNIFKLNMFPMLGDRLCFAWEHSIEKTQSVELGLEGLGLFGKYETGKIRGVVASASIRFYSLSKDNEGKYRLMNGTYLQPTVKAGYSSYDDTYMRDDLSGKLVEVKEHYVTNYWMALMQTGKQFIIYKRFCLDFTLGAGICIQTGTQHNPTLYNRNINSVFEHGFATISRTYSPFILTTSIRLGYVFK